MEMPKVYELRAEYERELGQIVLELWKGETRLASRPVEMQPHSTYRARLSIARAQLSAVAGVEIVDVRGA